MKKARWTMIVSRKPEERAFTLTELAIVLGVVGLIISAIWVAAGSVYNNRNIGHAQQEVVTIVQNIRALYPNRVTLPSGNAAPIMNALATAGVFPRDMVTQAVTDGTVSTYPLSPWGTPIQVVPYQVSQAGDAFYIEFDAGGSRVPTSACLALVGSMVGPGSDPGLIGVATSSGTWIGGTAAVGHATIANLDVTSLGNTCGDPTFLFTLL